MYNCTKNKSYLYIIEKELFFTKEYTSAENNDGTNIILMKLPLLEDQKVYAAEEEHLQVGQAIVFHVIARHSESSYVMIPSFNLPRDQPMH